MFKSKPKTVQYTILPTSGYCDIENMLGCDHILIAGTTGSGKSVLLNDIIYHILCTKAPVQSEMGAGLVLIDPKRVELSHYKDIPFCLAYGCEIQHIIQILDWSTAQMEQRYKFMQANELRLYPKNPIYIVIDELADLMTTSQREIAPRLQRIAQLGRAAKVFLICATQAPNRKVIPASLTLNFGIRIALRCLSPIESKQIIGTKGAEQLPRYGKCIQLSSQGYQYLTVPLTSDHEIAQVIAHWKTVKATRV